MLSAERNIEYHMKRTLFIMLIPFCSVLCCKAQELTPRFYWPSPRGTKVAVAGYSHVYGDVLMDPSIP
jgi:hypothetical protein